MRTPPPKYTPPIAKKKKKPIFSKQNKIDSSAKKTNTKKTIRELLLEPKKKQPALNLGITVANPGGKYLQEQDILKKRKKQAQIDLVKTVFSLVFALLILAIPIYGIFFSNYFIVQANKIKISGITQYIDEQKVHEITNATVGQKLWKLNTSSIENQINALPGVKSCIVSRDWPFGAEIKIDPRIAVAFVKSGKEFALIDQDAVPLSWQNTKPVGLPNITVPLNDKRVMNTVLDTLDLMSDKLKNKIENIKANTQDTVQFTIKKTGAKVIWGNSDQTELKERILLVMLKEKAKVYDVSAPTMPVTRNK